MGCVVNATPRPLYPREIHGILRLKCDGTRAKTRFRLRRNGRVHLNRRGRQFSRLLAAELRASAVVTLHTPRSEAVWRVLATHSIRQFPLHSLPLPCVTLCHNISTGLYPLHRRLGGPQGRFGRVRKISPPTGIRSPDHPARSESLHRLSYPGPSANSWPVLLFHS